MFACVAQPSWIIFKQSFDRVCIRQALPKLEVNFSSLALPKLEKQSHKNIYFRFSNFLDEIFLGKLCSKAVNLNISLSHEEIKFWGGGHCALTLPSNF